MTVKVAAEKPKRLTAALVAVVLAIAVVLVTATKLISADQRGARGPLESIVRLLEARSPGERSGATLNKLTKSKKNQPKEGGDELHERVLGKVFPSPPPSVVPPDDLLITPPPLGSLDTGLGPNPAGGIFEDILTPGGPLVYDAPPAGSGSNNGGGFGGSSGGGGGGSSGGGPIDGSNPPLTPNVPSAVPEPQSWALMLIGALLAARALRRGNVSRRRRSISDVSA